MTDESNERARARREYLVAGALAMAAAVLAVAFEASGGERGDRRLALLAVAALAAAMYGRVAWGLLRRRDGEPDPGPPADRMRRMAVIWYVLAGVLGAGLIRGPALALRGAGPEALAGREWLAAALGAALVVAAAARVVLFVARARGRKGAT